MFLDNVCILTVTTLFASEKFEHTKGVIKTLTMSTDEINASISEYY